MNRIMSVVGILIIIAIVRRRPSLSSKSLPLTALTDRPGCRRRSKRLLKATKF